MSSSRNIFLLFCSLFLIIASCRKRKCEDINCQAQCILGNKTNQIIYFSVGSTFYTDSLMPGESKNVFQTEINKDYNKWTCEVEEEGSSVITIYSSTGDWYVKIDDCEERSNFDYDGSAIKLFDEG